MDRPTRNMINSMHLNRKVLNEIVRRCAPADGVWKNCPKCHEDFNKLTETGLCFNCEETCNDC